MTRIKIIADSAAMVTSEQKKRYDIDTIHMVVMVDGQEYEDGKDLTSETFYDLLDQGLTASTAQPRLGSIIEKFEKYSSEYEHVLLFVMAEGLSGTYNSASSAIKMLDLPNVTVINSMSVCGAERAQVIKAAEMAEAGASIEMILSTIDEMRMNTGTFLVPFDLDHLKRGGRISTAAAKLGSMFKIKPVLTFVNHGAVIDKFAIARTEKKAYETIVDEVIKRGIQADDYDFFIYHSTEIKGAERLAGILNDKYPNVKVKIEVLTPTIGAHTGCHCVALQYIKR